MKKDQQDHKIAHILETRSLDSDLPINLFLDTLAPNAKVLDYSVQNTTNMSNFVNLFTGDRDTNIVLGHGLDNVFMGAGHDSVVFGDGPQNAFAGAGSDVFVFDHKTAGTNYHNIFNFKGAGEANHAHGAPQDLIVFAGYAPGSHLVLTSASDDFQSWAIVDKAGNLEGTFNVNVAADANGQYHLLEAGHDYEFVHCDNFHM